MANKIGVDKPILPRKRQVPAWLENALQPVPVFSSAIEMFKTFYSGGLESMICNLKNRFQQKG